MNLIYNISLLVFIVLGFLVYFNLWQFIPFFILFLCYLQTGLLNRCFSSKINEPRSYISVLSYRLFVGRGRLPDSVIQLMFMVINIIVLLLPFIYFSSVNSPIIKLFLFGNQTISLFDGINPEYKSIILIASIFLTFFSVFGIRYSEISEETKFQNVPWFRFLLYISVLYIISFAVSYLSPYITESAASYTAKITYILLYISLIGVLIVVLSVLWQILLKIKHIFSNTAFNGFDIPVFIEIIACESNLKRSFFSCFERRFSIDLSQSEIVSYIGRIFEPTVIASVLFFWLCTCVVIVPIDKECVICKFGLVDGSKAVGPGMHLKLPWPFADAKFFSTNKINVMNIGFEATNEKTDLIWSRRHSLTNDHLVVGDGVELINIDCQVYWKISNLYKYFSTMQNPEEFISSYAYKLLTLSTVTSTFDEIIARDRRTMTDKIRKGLQEYSDENGLGIEIVDVLFLAIHPPLQVADSFEDVISAKLDKLTYVLKAHTENEHKIHFHRADAVAVKLKAEMTALETIQRAEGEAASIVSRAEAYNAEPELEQFRLKLELTQKILSTKSLYIVDKDMMRPQDTIFLNMNNN